MVDTVSVTTNDGRNIIGVLKGYDQCINVILDNSFERVYSMSDDVQIENLGLFIVRGDNMYMLVHVFHGLLCNRVHVAPSLEKSPTTSKNNLKTTHPAPHP
ncbi:hypothetical protein B5M09_003376 [Aphanomyces astaci]|uniref:U6 snRNA-associated Sm-like protein LSm8 n=1 Tax=Aphanomyces astaci TaxID=112090 RepID=A0A425CUV5_APHAT|nr:hypothetical protein B5M09_003376 [Aphanomyces astaci]